MSCRPGLPQHRGWCCSARGGSTAAGMAAQGQSWRRRRTPLVQRHGVVPCGRWVGVCTLFEVLSSSFEGRGVQAVRELAAQCHRVDTGLPAQFPYSAWDGRMGRVGGTAPGYDSQVVSEGQRGEDSLLTRAPASYQSI
jgi:hypothetical protein